MAKTREKCAVICCFLSAQSVKQWSRCLSPQRFSRFRIESKLNKEPETLQINSLLQLYSTGSVAEKVFVQLTFAEGETDQYDKVLEKLDDCFTPKVDIIHERSIFHRRAQGPHKKTSNAMGVRCMASLSVRAQFPNQDEAIQDRLVFGGERQETQQNVPNEAWPDAENGCRPSKASRGGFDAD